MPVLPGGVPGHRAGRRVGAHRGATRCASCGARSPPSRRSPPPEPCPPAATGCRPASPPRRCCSARASLAGGFIGHPLTEALQPYVADFGTGEESHGIALWHGFSMPLLMSAVAVAGGFLLFWQRAFIARAQSTFPTAFESEEVYQKTMRGVDRLAVEVTARTQRGSLPGLPRLDPARRRAAARQRAAGHRPVADQRPGRRLAGPVAGRGDHDRRRLPGRHLARPTAAR